MYRPKGENIHKITFDLKYKHNGDRFIKSWNLFQDPPIAL